ncbi:MAG: DUF3943 domain-containing protein [Deltaproteobacteria bacterium]|nr:DUF3943 domain-containing protein [Deltaproteobacteria bacterium]
MPERSLAPAAPTEQVDLFADRYVQQQAEARKHLGIMSAVTILSGVAIMTLMTLLPQEATNWDSGDDKWTNFKDAWTSPPEWDKDDWPVNYLVHPWMGAIFYLLARDLGAEPLASFAYSTGLSFSWEYLVESWSEQPSAQDLLTTSPIGSLLGEGFYRLRTGPLHDDTDGFTWKKAAGWILDPVDLTYTLTGMKPEPPPLRASPSGSTESGAAPSP